jgi:K+-sensing histidine kinase KdpD
MPMRAAAPLLSLLGHELRAPAGVVGGYLALLEQQADRLTPQQRQALAGARRGQLAIVEALDDLRRLTSAWKADDEPLTSMTVTHLAAEMTRVARERGVEVAIEAVEGVAVVRRGRDAALAESLVTVAEAVAREADGAVAAAAAVDDGALVWRLRFAARGPAEDTVRVPFDMWRPGLGVRLVTATAVVESAGGRLDDVRSLDGLRVGVDVTLPLAGAPAATGGA